MASNEESASPPAALHEEGELVQGEQRVSGREKTRPSDILWCMSTWELTAADRSPLPPPPQYMTSVRYTESRPCGIPLSSAPRLVVAALVKRLR